MNKYPNQYDEKYILTGKEKDEEIASFIRDKISIYDDQNKRTARQWLLNAAFARGNQWSVLHDTEDRLINSRKPAGRKLVTDDMVGAWKEYVVANLTIAQPVWETVPKGIKNNDIMAARTGNDILKAYWDEWRFIEKQIELAGYLVDFCNAIILLRYDETKHKREYVYDSETNEMIYDANNNPVAQFVQIGDISAHILPPQYLGCPLDSSDLDEKPWIFIQQARSLGYARKYGKIGEKLISEKMNSTQSNQLWRLSRGRQEDAKQDKEFNEVWYMQKPCDECPDGLIIPYAQETLLETDRDKWTWQFEQMKEYPVIHVHGRKESGEFWARSSIERQIPLQRYLNLLRSCMADNVDNMAHLKWLVHNTSDVSEISDMNEMITYGGTSKPEMSDVKPLPAWISDERDSTKASIRDIQSYHGASQGTAVSGVRSDLHAQNLQDQDLMPYTTLDNLVSTAYARMGEKILHIVAEKLSAERITSFLNDSRQEIIANFKEAITDKIARVNVKMTSAILRSKGMVKKEIYNWFGAGMIADDYGRPDAQAAMQLLEFAVPDSYYDKYRVHSNQAHLENIRMYNGEAPVPYSWQNHMIHLKTHREEMNSPRFMQLLDTFKVDKNGKVIEGEAQTKQVTDTFVAHVQKTALILEDAMKPMASAATKGTSQEGRPAETSKERPQQTPKKTSR